MESALLSRSDATTQDGLRTGCGCTTFNRDLKVNVVLGGKLEGDNRGLQCSLIAHINLELLIKYF